MFLMDCQKKLYTYIHAPLGMNYNHFVISQHLKDGPCIKLARLYSKKVIHLFKIGAK